MDWTRPLTLKEQAEGAFISKLTGLAFDEIDKLKKRILTKFCQRITEHLQLFDNWTGDCVPYLPTHFITEERLTLRNTLIGK